MTTWRKSSYSADNGCFELADLGPDVVGLRDSKLGDDSPVLRLSREQAADLIGRARNGEFDHMA